MNDGIVIQSPPRASALFLLFHGVGATPQDLVPLGTRLAREFPQAAIVSVPGPDRSDLGRGLQWFSVMGVTERDRPKRVAATLDRFVATVQAWQQRTGVAPADTTLIGFSQGAIMALAASGAAQPPAARVVSLSGRFSELPTAAPAGVRIHFLHGDADPVIPAAHAQQAARQLQALGAAVTLDVVPGLGHGISAASEDLLVRRLRAT
jgi:phospholipase/carboxylesterase